VAQEDTWHLKIQQLDETPKIKDPTQQSPGEYTHVCTGRDTEYQHVV